MKSYKALSILVLLFEFFSNQSFGAPPICKQISAPAIITVGGQYCVTQDIVATNTDAIDIFADNVTLNLQNHTISNATPRSAALGGIIVYGQNVNIRGTGTIQGFNPGIILGNALPAGSPGNYFVTNVTINNASSTTGRSVGIYVTATNASLSNNDVSNVSGATDAYGFFITNGSQQANNGIATSTGKIVLQSNQISQITATGENGNAAAIYAETAGETIIGSNTIQNINAFNTMTTRWYAYGIEVFPVPVQGPQGLIEISDNYMWNPATATYSIGIELVYTQWPANLVNRNYSIIRDSTILGMNKGIDIYSWDGNVGNALYLYNTVYGAAIPYNGGTAGPNNQRL